MNELLNHLINRSDVFNLDLVHSFFDFDNMQIHNINTYSYSLLAQSRQIQNEIIDLDYDKELNLIFCVCGNKDNLLTKTMFTFFDEKGNLSIFQYTNIAYGEKTLKLIFSQSFVSTPTKIKYFPLKKEIIIAFHSGEIKLLSLVINNDRISLHPLSLIKTVHSSSVINFFYFPENGYIYSIAKGDKSVSISEINYEKKIAEINIGSITVSFDILNTQMLIADSTGSFWLYSINKDNINDVTFKQAIHTNYTILNVSLHPNDAFFAVCVNTFIIFEINTKSDVVIIKQKLSINTSLSISSSMFLYDSTHNDIIVGMSNGTFQLWSHTTSLPEIIVIAHRKGINAMLRIADDIIITASRDSDIKVWKRPSLFLSELCRNNKLLNEESSIANAIDDSMNSISKIKNAFAMMNFDDDTSQEKEQCSISDSNDEDDGTTSLDGWDEATPVVLSLLPQPPSKTVTANTRSVSFSKDGLFSGIKSQYSYIKRALSLTYDK